MDALLDDQREARPAADRGLKHESRLAPARAVLALLGPHPSFRWIAPGYGSGCGAWTTPLLMLENLYYGSVDAVNHGL